MSKSNGNQTEERVPIVFASDLPPCETCGEPWCEFHRQHYSNCDCVGPHNAEELGYTIEIDKDGKQWATRKVNLLKQSKIP